MYRSLATIKGDLVQAELGAMGKGIVWAVVSSGVNGDHPHFQLLRNLDLPEGLHHMDFSAFERPRRFDFEEMDLLGNEYVVTKPVDPLGYGTAVAGIIAGQGHDDDQLMKSVAPEAKILSIKVFGEGEQTSEFNVLAALHAIQQINANGDRLRIHGVVVPVFVQWDAVNYACGPVCVEVDRLVNSGVVVVAPVGDRAFDRENNVSREGGIFDPANAELAISVGATHRWLPQIYGASYFSSRGPTADGRRKPDLLAPGEKISTCANDFGPYQVKDGTSYAAAHVAGAAAALLSLQPDLIGKPLKVKEILLRTAVDLGREVMYQGAGLVDVLAAAQIALGDSAADKTEQAKPLVKVFCSYSHRDGALWEELKAHLSSLERSGLIEVWSDQLIEGGQEWEKEIYKNLDTADVVLLLVSAYFLKSEFAFSKELRRALERQAEGRTRVIPIRARPVTLLGTVLEKIQALPVEAKPVTSFPDPHEAWAQVTQKLYEIVTSMKKGEAASGKHKSVSVEPDTGALLLPASDQPVRLLIEACDREWAEGVNLSSVFFETRGEGTAVGGYFEKLEVVNGDRDPIEVRRVWFAILDVTTGKEIEPAEVKEQQLEPYDSSMGRLIPARRTHVFGFKFHYNYYGRIRKTDRYRFILRLEVTGFPIISSEIPEECISA